MIERSFVLTKRWALRIPTQKVIVIYDTMYGATERLAAAAVEGAASVIVKEKVGKDEIQHHVVVDLIPARSTAMLSIVSEVLDAAVVLVGSCTFNNTYMPSVAKVLHVLKSYAWKDKKVGIFGSYGWSKAGIQQL